MASQVPPPQSFPSQIARDADAAHKRPSPLTLAAVIGMGVLAISCASILIRFADAPALTIASYRVALATLVLLPRHLWAGGHSSIARPDSGPSWWIMILSGTFLALHFVFWIESVQKTTVASSVTLVSTSPLFTALFSALLFKERPRPWLWIGIAACVLGSAVVGGSDSHSGQESLEGDLLALLGASMASGYLLAGRALRPRMPLISYLVGTYGTAALVLLLLALITQTPLHGFSTQTYGAMILLALVPQLLGHSSFNWALRHLSATSVAILTLGEPIGASLLAFLILGEGVGPTAAVGLGLLAGGILVGSLATTPSGCSPTPAQPAGPVPSGQDTPRTNGAPPSCPDQTPPT